MMYNRLQLLDILSLDGFYIDSFVLRSILSSNDIKSSFKDENGVEFYSSDSIAEVKRIIKSGEFTRDIVFEDLLGKQSKQDEEALKGTNRSFEDVFNLPAYDTYKLPATQKVGEISILPKEELSAFTSSVEDVQIPQVPTEAESSLSDKSLNELAEEFESLDKQENNDEDSGQDEDSATISLQVWQDTLTELDELKVANVELSKQNRALRLEVEATKFELGNLSQSLAKITEPVPMEAVSSDVSIRESDIELVANPVTDAGQFVVPDEQEEAEAEVEAEAVTETVISESIESEPILRPEESEQQKDIFQEQIAESGFTESKEQQEIFPEELLSEYSSSIQDEPATDEKVLEPNVHLEQVKDVVEEEPVFEQMLPDVTASAFEPNVEEVANDTEPEEDMSVYINNLTDYSQKKRTSSFFSGLFGSKQVKERINLYKELKSLVSKDTMEMLEVFGRVAERYHYRIFLVGGAVRDVMLSKQIVDIDILVEGNAITLAQLFEKHLGVVILKTQPELGTAKVQIDGFEVDLASTREEVYPKPGKLPVVKQIGCALELDIVRRDFTINTMALALNGEKPFELIDDLFGKNDLETKELRILHKKSFIDDPTRIIRGLRFAVRFGLFLESETQKAQMKYLQSKTASQEVCFERVKSELRQTFELNSPTAYDLYVREGVYKLVNETVNLNISGVKIKQLLDTYGKNATKPWLVYFGASIACFSTWKVTEIVERLLFSKSEALIITNAIEMIEKPNSGMQDNFVTYRFFQGKDIESILIYYLQTKDATVIKFLEDLQNISIELNGEDLINMGLSPSPMFSTIFQELLKAKLNNQIDSKEEEIQFVQALLKKDK